MARRNAPTNGGGPEGTPAWKATLRCCDEVPRKLLLKRIDQFVDGPADGRRKFLPHLKIAAGDGVERGFGRVPVERLRPGQQRLGSCMMGYAGARRGGAQRDPVD